MVKTILASFFGFKLPSWPLVLDTHSKWLPLVVFYSYNEANMLGSFILKLALTALALSDYLVSSVATVSMVALRSS